ncbi:hypothetical protein SAMN04488564_10872 [Lentzea waywayandensis]|uniref:Uncharacterized protein n=1 Tax=Lentzea waywayandensis TaxID=84724 RepID=A0A1I6F4C3_9PSEU|nr:hypothetical protein [Lentzea waywayandensis]SFR24791.1 hypothetical protein SAMN04488564_10872 [Lentzea waywayandensis]
MRYEETLPGALRDAVRKVCPPPDFDESIRHVIGDWVLWEEPTATVARREAEPHVHGYLERAAAAGATCGRAFARIVLLPVTVLLLMLFVLLALL